MRAIFYILLLSALFACQQTRKESQKTEEKKTEEKLNSSLAIWDGFDFSDTTMIHRPEVTERSFSTFLALLLRQEKNEQNEAIAQFMSKTYKASPRMFSHFCQLAEKYLHDPNSPFRNDDLYIPFLKYMVEIEGGEESDKERARFQLQMVMKNRVGDVAENLHLLTNFGKESLLHEIESPYLLLFFYNPECEECRWVKEYIKGSSEFRQWQKQGRLRILAVYPDEDMELWQRHLHDNPKEWITARLASIEDADAFYLQAIPTLYLLDSKKRVLLKDVEIEDIVSNMINEVR